MDNFSLPPIRMLVLTLTGRCNYACRYCYASGQPEEDMSEETALAALSLAAESGKRFLLQFSGGEPLLRFPLIRRAAEECEKNHWNVQMQIQTNGSLLTRDIARWLYDHHVGIGLSLDGKPSVNDRQRVNKDGSSAAAGTAKGFYALAEAGVAAGLTCAVTEENADCLETVVDMAYFYGNVRQLGFDILREQGRGTGMRPLSAEKFSESLRRAYRRRERLREMTGRNVLFTHEERIRTLKTTGKYDFPQCYAMHGEAAFVDVCGTIYACSSLMGMPEFALGDVKRGRDPERVRRVGGYIAEAMAACRSCDAFPLCGGGCFSRWLDKAGNPRRSYPECAMKRFFIGEFKKKNFMAGEEIR